MMTGLNVYLLDHSSRRGHSSMKQFEDNKVYVSIGMNHAGDGESHRMASVDLRAFGITVYGGDEFVMWLNGIINDDEEKVEASKYGLGESEFTEDSTKGDKIFALAFREAMMQIAHMSGEFVEYFLEIKNESYRAGKEFAKKEFRQMLGIYQ